jgi:hypothetical protein
MIDMSRNSKPYSEARGHPAPAKTRWQFFAETIADCGRGFHRQDTFCFTVIGALALMASTFGHAGIYPLVFASIFMVIIPILRRLKLVDQWNDGHQQPLGKHLGKW